MTKVEYAKLQRLINKAVATSNAFHHANQALMEYCRDIYGYEPGDIDADEIIDGVTGANGICDGMLAEDFDRIMREG